MQVTVAREYAHLFQNLFLEDDETTDVAEMYVEEANYAYSVGEGEKGFGMLPRGIPYYGSYGPGCDYLAGLFATLGDVMYHVDDLHGHPGVRVQPDGTIDTDDMAEV